MGTVKKESYHVTMFFERPVEEEKCHMTLIHFFYVFTGLIGICYKYTWWLFYSISPTKLTHKNGFPTGVEEAIQQG